MFRCLLGIAVRLGGVCLALGFIAYAVVIERAESAQYDPIEPRSGPSVDECRLPIYDLEWSPGGARLLAVHKSSDGRGNALLFDLSTQMYDGSVLPLSVTVRRAVFDRDSDAVLAGTDSGDVWRVDAAEETATKIAELAAATGGFSSMRAVSGGMVLATLNDVRLVDSAGQIRWVLPEVDSVRHIAVSSDGSQLIMPLAFGKTIVVSTTTGRVERTLPGAGLACPAVFRDGRGVVICDARGKISLWDLKTGEERWQIQHDCPLVASLTATAERRIVVGDWMGMLVQLDAEGREVRRTQAHRGAVSTLGVSTDGRTLASGGHDGKIFLWNPDTLEQIDQIH